MKFLIVLAALSTQFAHASIIQCLSDDNEFTITADIDFGDKKVHSMEYFREGTKYLEFSNLDMDYSNNIFTNRRDFYEIRFNASALYMDLFVDKNGVISGWFLPKNSILAFERKITCQMI